LFVVLLPCVLGYNPGGRQDFMPLDQCFPYKTCETCIAEKFCGWCSTPVVGGNGAQCAGFSPDNKTSPFICYGTYQTTTCVFPTTGTSGTGTTGTTTTTTTTSSTTTGPSPTPPVTGFWRGLQINNGYVKGEWTFNFTKDYVNVEGPGSQMWGGNVFSSATEMDIKIDEGDNKGSTLYGIYEQDYGPASIFLTYAVSPVTSTYPPSSWGVAMNSKAYTVWILEQPKPF